MHDLASLIDSIIQVIVILQSKAIVVNSANLEESLEILNNPTVNDFLNRAYDNSNYTLAKDVLTDIRTNFESVRYLSEGEMKTAFETNRIYLEELEQIGERIRKEDT